MADIVLGSGPAQIVIQVDAAIVWPLVSYKSLVDGEYRSLMDFGKTMDPVLPNTWAFSNGMIDQKSDVIRRWLALAGGVESGETLF